MIKVMLDTNFLLDVALEARTGSADAERLFDKMSDGSLLGVVSPTSLKDFYYITRKDFDEETRRGWLALFLDAFTVADFGRLACQSALESDEPDFEDGIVRALAELERCNAIVSRDSRAFASSMARRVSASQALEMLDSH